MSPKRWHVYVVDLEPRIGTKPGKQRPCVAIQSNVFTALESTLLLPISTNLIDDAFPLRIRIPKGVCELKKESDILVDQIIAWDNAAFGRDLGELPPTIRSELVDALREFLDLA